MSSYRILVWECPYLSAYVVFDDLYILCKTTNKGMHVRSHRKYSEYMHAVTNSRLHGMSQD